VRDWLFGRALVGGAPPQPVVRRVGLALDHNCGCPFCLSLGRCMTLCTTSVCGLCVAGDHRPARRRA
jgi:hypothetical protein